MLGSSSVQWDLRLPWGSNVGWVLQLWKANGIEPFPMGGHTFEYVVRTAPTDVGTPLIRLKSDNPSNPLPAGGGTLVVTTTAVESALTLTLSPPATQLLTPPVTLYHALWMDYADAANALNLWWGQFMIDPAVQP